MARTHGEQGALLWVAGVGPDAEALHRLEQHFRMPASPMGEAWFLGKERRLFTELMNEAPDQWPIDLIETVLHDLSSGPGCFGPLQEWTDWLHYLTPKLLPRISDWQWACVYESLISAFMAHYPDERGRYPYSGFLEDILATLGRVPMASFNWKDGCLAEDGLISPIHDSVYGLSVLCGGSFSAGIFINLKYLDEESAISWLASLFAIDDTVWRIKLVLWISKSSALLLDPGNQPDVLENEPSNGSGWSACWCLGGSKPSPEVDPSQLAVPFLSGPRLQLFRRELQRHLTCASLADLGARLEEMERSTPDLYGIRVQLDMAAGEIIRDYQLR